jgi:phosphatidylglycerophosphate synthase
MGRVAEIRARAQRRTGNLYDTWFTRRVSAWVTAALIPTGVSANAVSAANLLVGGALCALIATGAPPWAALGAALVHLYAVLDSVDGELARWHRRPSVEGMFLENWSAYLMINGFGLAVGAYLWRRGHGLWPLGLAVAVAALGREAAPAMRRTVLELLERNPGFARERAVPAPERGSGGGVTRKGGRWRRFVEESLLYQTNVWLVLSTLVLVEQLAGVEKPPLVLAAFVFYSAGSLVKEVATVLLAVRTPWIGREIGAALEASRPGEPPS